MQNVVWESVDNTENNYLAASEMEDGDTVEGTLRQIITRESQYKTADGKPKTQYVLKIEKPDGETVMLSASGTLASKTLRFGNLAEGDYILIKKDGVNKFKAKNGSTVEEGNFEVKRRKSS